MLNTAIYLTAFIILSTKTVYIIVSGNLEIQRSFRNICWLYPPSNAHKCVNQIDSMLMAWSFFIHTLQ